MFLINYQFEKMKLTITFLLENINKCSVKLKNMKYKTNFTIILLYKIFSEGIAFKLLKDYLL